MEMDYQVGHRHPLGYPWSAGGGVDGLLVIHDVACLGSAAQVAVLIAQVPLNVSFVT